MEGTFLADDADGTELYSVSGGIHRHYQREIGGVTAFLAFVFNGSENFCLRGGRTDLRGLNNTTGQEE